MNASPASDRSRTRLLSHRGRRGFGHGERAADPDAVVRSAAVGGAREGAHEGVGERVPAGDEAHAHGEAHVQQHPADRGDEPRRQPRPGAPATGPVRPQAVLRPPDQVRAPRADRLLPRPEDAPRAARRRPHARSSCPRRLRLHAGDDRAPVRRGVARRAPRGPHGDEQPGHPRGQAHRGARLQAAGQLRGVGPRVGGDPRGRPRHRRLPGGQGSPARGAVDHQAPAGARPARAR